MQSGEITEDSPPIDIVVYFHDNSGIQLKVQNGQNIEASTLFDLVIKELEIDDETVPITREVFSLWLVSDLLELQLKPNHVPFKLVCYWEELLEKYVHCSEETRQRDEPIIMFRKNIYIRPSLEEEINQECLLKYLYHEARKNIVEGRYPVIFDEFEMLAACQTQIYYMEKTKEDQDGIVNFGSPEFFLEHLKEFLPSHHCRRNLLWNRKQNPEHRLSLFYESQKTVMGSLDLPSLYRTYLKICRKFFVYGSAFFRGQAEHPKKKVDDPVWIAVNRRGVSVICITEQALLLSAPFEKLSWQCAESNSSDYNVLPCLFLHFHYFENGQEVTKLLQIFSRSAFLADNLIDAFVTLKTKEPPVDDADRKYQDVLAKLDRLALVTFDRTGNKLKSSIRLPK